MLDKRPFDLKIMQLDYAHTGWEAPEQIEIGKYKFYYYGPGGGRVAYPDDYFYDLNGYTLEISFDGSYSSNEKTPTEKVKQMERTVLRTFRIFQPSND